VAMVVGMADVKDVTRVVSSARDEVVTWLAEPVVVMVMVTVSVYVEIVGHGHMMFVRVGVPRDWRGQMGFELVVRNVVADEENDKLLDEDEIEEVGGELEDLISAVVIVTVTVSIDDVKKGGGVSRLVRVMLPNA